MRLQNPKVAGNTGMVSYSAPKQRSIANPKFLITLEMLLMIAIVGWLAVDLYFTLNPLHTRQVSQDISSLSLNQELIVEQLKELEDVYIVKDSLELKSKATAITKQVVDQIQTGDYVIELNDSKILVFRPSTETIVYTGADFDLIEDVIKRDLYAEITEAARKQKIVNGSNQPELELIEDISALIRTNGSLFANANVGDVIAYFMIEQRVVVYDAETSSIVGSAVLQTSTIEQ